MDMAITHTTVTDTTTVLTMAQDIQKIITDIDLLWDRKQEPTALIQTEVQLQEPMDRLVELIAQPVTPNPERQHVVQPLRPEKRYEEALQLKGTVHEIVEVHIATGLVQVPEELIQQEQ